MMTPKREASVLVRAFCRTRARLDRIQRELDAAGALTSEQACELVAMREGNAPRLDAAEPSLPERVQRLRAEEADRLDPRIVIVTLVERDDGTWYQVVGA